MDLESLFGLPAHPLVVHAAVVLLPLAAVGSLVVAAVPRTRRHYAPLVLAVSLTATIAVGLAQSSGEELEGDVRETELVEAHTSRGESVLPWAIAVTVVAAAATVASRRLDTSRPLTSPRWLTAGLVVIALVAGTGATWSVIDVGHSGAKATWSTIEDGSTDGEAGR